MTFAQSGFAALGAQSSALPYWSFGEVVTATTTTATVEVPTYPGVALGPYPLINPAIASGDDGDGPHTHAAAAPTAGTVCIVFFDSIKTAYVLPVNGVQ